MKRIKYICYYNGFSNSQHRNFPLPAKNKMDYIIATINDLGIGVDLVSCASAECNEVCLQRSQNLKESNNTLKLFWSVGGRSKWCVAIDLVIVRIQLVLYLLFKIRKHEEVIVYHSMGYAYILYIIGRLKGIKYIGEIEELYQDVSTKSNWSRNTEYNFVNYCSKYIFSTDLLKEKLNQQKKPYVIVHGIYKMEPQLGEGLFNDDKIHIVYAGTLDPRKGSIDAIQAAKYLPSNYHLHILGFGSPKQIDTVMKAVTNEAGMSHAGVSYDGVLDGINFKRFLQSCKIGLATQDPEASFTSTSFPSKILTYLSNGLSVVSIDIPSIRRSAVGNIIILYAKQDAQSIAEAILSQPIGISFFKRNENILNSLDISFREKLKQLIV